MSRPGFVLEVDDRTPPLIVHEGLGFRLEDKSVKLLLQWMANGANEEELQQLFSTVDTGRWRTSRRCVG